MFILTGFGDEISPDLNEQIKIFKKEGINYLELRGVNNKNVLDLNNKEIKEIKEALDKNNIKISAIGSPVGKIGINDNFIEHLEKFKRALYLAKFFNTPYIRIFSYYIPENENPRKYRDEVIRRMRVKTELAAKENIILLHENESKIYGNISNRCRDILDTVNSKNLKAIFDPANFVVEGEKPFTDCFDKLVNYVLYLHIKDARFGKSVHITPAGEGDGEIKEILNALKQRNFNGFLSLEPHLSMAGSMSGFTGPELFMKASQALKKVLKEINAQWM